MATAVAQNKTIHPSHLLVEVPIIHSWVCENCGAGLYKDYSGKIYEECEVG